MINYMQAMAAHYTTIKGSYDRFKTIDVNLPQEQQATKQKKPDPQNSTKPQKEESKNTLASAMAKMNVNQEPQGSQRPMHNAAKPSPQKTLEAYMQSDRTEPFPLLKLEPANTNQHAVVRQRCKCFQFD